VPLGVKQKDGTSWHGAAIGPYVFDVSAIDLNVWALTSTCAAGESGARCTVGIEESIDGGNTWTEARPFNLTVEPEMIPLQPIELARITTTRAYVLTNIANLNESPSWQIQSTRDGGATWASFPVPCAGAFGDGAEVAASSTNDLWLMCGSQASAGIQSKELYRSSDGGVIWTLTAATGLGTPPPATVLPNPLPLGGYVAPFSVGHRNLAVLSATTAWLYPFRGGLYKSTDGGQSWASIPALSAAGFDSGGEGNVTFFSASQGWICDYGIGLWHTSDGVTWSPLGVG